MGWVVVVITMRPPAGADAGVREHHPPPAFRFLLVG